MYSIHFPLTFSSNILLLGLQSWQRGWRNCSWHPTSSLWKKIKNGGLITGHGSPSCLCTQKRISQCASSPFRQTGMEVITTTWGGHWPLSGRKASSSLVLEVPLTIWGPSIPIVNRLCLGHMISLIPGWKKLSLMEGNHSITIYIHYSLP